ncbi:hypothetical protein GGD56_005543 [Rhizobium mongolense]|uniref:Uncharacterized protein n=2 Tax=Rhizobium mongolense TaxID=57676 RepID=A0ABR6IVH4_9HYPH|nr:hypothetical protein [Rhizobium mongolense]TVZ64238.1 hypothetical protein BCL32_4462 [Rhizobium mongolense USDA 1844]
MWTLANTSSGCVKLFEHLNESLDGSSLRELYIWTKTLSCYKDPDDLLIYLQRAGLSNGRADGEFHMQHFSFYHDTVTGYIANAIEAEKHP